MSARQLNSQVSELKSGNHDTLRELFDSHFAYLMRIAYSLTQNREVSEELVQDVFVSLWNGRANLNEDTSFNGYLNQAVKNRCYTYFRRKSDFDIVDIDDAPHSDISIMSDCNLEASDLAQSIRVAISSLPEKTRVVFQMSREHELSYDQIAEELNISSKTVEYHMTNALKLLRESLSPLGYLSLIMTISYLW
ncbi:RNA polymerase sigma-70 factor [Reichenbachiella versicolor]|uniref:RNA polymerase sigma-70 factor n=1 Tax=Reichenbachiella versicolor TaxID=1821036 RepID=UPI000D6E030E|nr:RNA polymerase sigma-70 factor [Reichenbachiella versicolor]